MAKLRTRIRSALDRTPDADLALAPGFGSHGEPVRCARAKSGKITALKIAGTTFLFADKMAREMEARYGAGKPTKPRGT